MPVCNIAHSRMLPATYMKELKLKYHPKWIEYNFISEVEVENQFLKFQKGVDKNDEHFRYKSFLKWISKRSKFTDDEVSKYIELVDLDEDQTMANSALIELFRSEKLTPTQYSEVRNKISTYGDWAIRLIEKQEKPEEQPFNTEFCEVLEFKLTEALSKSYNSEYQKMWCDGIESKIATKKEVNDRKQINTRAWIGEDGQTEYILIIYFGKYSLRRYAKGTNMEECIPESESPSWINIDSEKKIAKVFLK